MKIGDLVLYTDPEEVQGVVLKTQSEYWLLIDPDATGGVFIYDYQRNRWYVDDYNNIKALGVFEASGGIIDTDYNQSDIVVVKIGYLVPELYNMRGDWIMAMTPGGVDQDLERLGYKNIKRPMFPLDKDMEKPDLSARLIPASDE